MSKIFKLVIDATVEFCQLHRPSFSQKMQIQDLLIAYLENLPSSDIKTICHHLATSENVPKTLVLKLCEQEADICRPLLLESNTLQEAELEALASGAAQLEHARIIARRTNLPRSVSALLRDFEDDKIDRALDLRQRPLSEAQLATQHALENEDLADEAFQSLCNEPNDTIIHTAFADRLGLKLSSCEILCADLTSRNLPTAMKYMGLSESTAWSLYRRLAKSVADRPRVAEAFKATYNCLTREQCRSIIGEWRMDELVMLVRADNAANDTRYQAANDRFSA